MNDERKTKLIKVAELLGRVCDMMDEVRYEEMAQYDSLTDQQRESDYGYAVSTNIDDMEEVLDELDNAQTALVELTNNAQANEEENKYVRHENDEDKLISALGWDRDSIDKSLSSIKRFCNRIGIEMDYELRVKE